jgi:CheY-like chemotaxis protein
MNTAHEQRALRVLVVDDSRDNVDSMALFLRLRGYEVHRAYDGPSALALAQEHRPEAVLLDVAMPMMDGFQLAQRIRERFADKPKPALIAITGYGDEAMRCRIAAEGGFDSYFLKPADPDLIARLIKEIANKGGSG